MAVITSSNGRTQTLDVAYNLALLFVTRVDRDLKEGTGHYRNRSGHLLRTLGQVVEAALCDDLIQEGNGASMEDGQNGSTRRA